MFYTRDTGINGAFGNRGCFEKNVKGVLVTRNRGTTHIQGSQRKELVYFLNM